MSRQEASCRTPGRTFTAVFKQGVVFRLEAGERRAAVADEPEIERKLGCGRRGGAVGETPEGDDSDNLHEIANVS